MKRRAIRPEPLFFERNPQRVKRQGVLLPKLDVPDVDPNAVLPEGLVRKPDPDFPDISEMETVQHFHRLSQLNYAVDEEKRSPAEVAHELLERQGLLERGG